MTVDDAVARLRARFHDDLHPQCRRGNACPDAPTSAEIKSLLEDLIEAYR